jgi:hypothetical protein
MTETEYKTLIDKLDLVLVGLHHVLTAIQSQQSPKLPQTCETCLWFLGKICCRHTSPHHNQRVDPDTDTCDLYKWTRHPARAVIAKVGEPQGYQHGRIVCSRCGHLVRARKDGSMERHDIDGRMFRGRAGGDRSKECTDEPA